MKSAPQTVWPDDPGPSVPSHSALLLQESAPLLLPPRSPVDATSPTSLVAPVLVHDESPLQGASPRASLGLWVQAGVSISSTSATARGAHAHGRRTERKKNRITEHLRGLAG